MDRCNRLFVAVLFTGTALIGIAGPALADVSSGLVAYWPFDDGANPTADATGNGHDATLFGPVYLCVDEDVAPILGNVCSLELDGIDDFVTAGSVDFAQGDYTVAGWFNPDTLEIGEPNDGPDIFAATTFNHGILIEVEEPGNAGAPEKLRYLHRFPIGGTGGTDIFSTTTVDVGRWQHFAALKAGANMRLYLDGELVGSAIDASTFDRPLDITIGRIDPFRALRFWNGLIDEIRLYNRALSDDEIKQLAASPFLAFPLEEDTPWTAEISSVHDHSVKTDKDGILLYYRNNDGVVQAYAGLPGKRKCEVADCVQRFNNNKVLGYKNENGEQFFFSGDITYTGGGGCEVRNSTVDCHFWLFYDGHSGYDYPAPLGTPIIAPADGHLFIPQSDPITSPLGDPVGAVDTFHIMAIDHGNGFSTWYLHVGREAGTDGLPDEQDFRLIMPGDDPIFVEQGAEIGAVGNRGLCTRREIRDGECPADLAHLHFEVRAGVSDFACEPPDCRPVDPYGPGARLWLEEPPE